MAVMACSSENRPLKIECSTELFEEVWDSIFYALPPNPSGPEKLKVKNNINRGNLS